MEFFEDTDDVREWFAPLDYGAFWEAVAPYGLRLQARDHCDGLIARGEVPQSLILRGLKMMARVELTEMYALPTRIYEPTVAKYLTTTH